MKTYRDLYLHLNGDDIDEFIEKLTGQCQPPWRRDRAREDDPSWLDETLFCFERSKNAGSPSAALFLFRKEDDTWYVSNIVPTETRELTYDQYNAILEEFLRAIVQPVIEGTAIVAEMTNDEISVGTVAGEKVEEALVRFSTLANKSTGSSHPSDRKRWFEFLVLANEANSDLNADLVVRALIEMGWSEEQAQHLGSQFEEANELLSYYREW